MAVRSGRLDRIDRRKLRGRSLGARPLVQFCVRIRGKFGGTDFKERGRGIEDTPTILS
jgi:hypothetical protein